MSEQVLRAAERRMLGEPGGPEDSRATAEPEALSWRGVLRRLARPRNLIWPAVAAAAGLLLFFVNPGSQEPGPGGPPGGTTVAMKGAQPPRVTPPAPREALLAPAEKTDPPAATARSADQAAVSPAAKADRTEADTIRTRSLEAGPEGAAKEEKDKEKGPSDFPAKGTDDLLLVRCEVTPEALQGGALEQVLDKLQITDKRDVTRQQAQPLDAALWRCVEAEATLSQIEAILKELESQPASFLAVSRPPSARGGGPDAAQTAQRALPPKDAPGQMAQRKAPTAPAPSLAKKGGAGPSGAIMVAPPGAPFQVQSSPNQAVSPRAGSGLAASPGLGSRNKIEVLPGGTPSMSVQIPLPTARKVQGPGKAPVPPPPESVAKGQAPETAKQRVLFVLQVVGSEQRVGATQARAAKAQAAKAAAKAAAAVRAKSPEPAPAK